MKKSAIQFALYLHLHPKAGIEQWQLMRALPHGMSDLLQTAASGQKRTEIADSLGIEETDLRQALIKFLQLVISDYQKSPYRGLATREQSSLETCTKHKKLLQNIFHPDKFQSDKAHQLIQQIQQSHEEIRELNIQKENEAIAAHFTASAPTEEEEQVMRFQVNSSPRPSSAHRRREQKKQTNYVLMAGIAGLALAGLLVVLIVPSNPQEMVRQQIVVDTTPEPSKKLILASSVNSTSSSQTFTDQNQGATVDNAQIQLLMNEFERGLEGDHLANELLNTKTPSQSSKEIMSLFASADQKKVFFHGFSWSKTQTGFYGQGEFLVRFQFSNKNQWVTRKGKSSITLTNNNSKLLIDSFHFEDNLH